MSRSVHAGDPAGQPARELTRLAPAALLAAAGGLHLAALPGHLSESPFAGAFFAVTAAAQLLGALLVATRPSRRTHGAVVVGTVAVLTLWLISRTVGLPIGGGLGVSEPFGLLDGLAAAAEILVVVAALTAMVRYPVPSARRCGGWRLAVALALMWGGSGGAGLAMADESHHHGGAHGPGVSASRGHSHEAPAASGHSGDSSVSPSVIGAGCPAGHDCTDHPH